MRFSIDRKGSDGFSTPTLFVIRTGSLRVFLAAAGAAGSVFLQTGRDLKSGPHGAFHKIDFKGFDTFKKVFIDHKRNPQFCKNSIIIP